MMFTSLLLAVGGCLTGQNPPADAAHKPLKWGADPNGGLPYFSKDKKGNLSGFEYDLAMALGREMQRTIEPKKREFEDLFKNLRHGDIDFAMNGLETSKENRAQARFTRPYYAYRLQLVVRKGEKRFRTLDQARDAGVTIGTLLGSEAERVLGRAGVRTKAEADQDGPFKQLTQGREIDGILMDLPIALYYAVSELPRREESADVYMQVARRYPGLEFAGEPFGKGYYAIAVRPDDDKLFEELDRALETLIRRGDLKQILQKWDLWNVDQYNLLAEPVENEPTVLEMPFSIYLPLLFHAALATVDITLRSMLLAIVLALPIALCRMYGPAPLRWLAVGYVEFFRGIPVLLLLYFLYYGLTDAFPAISMQPMTAAVLGFGLNYAAYEAEVYRAGIGAVPVGQWEAAASLGMTPGQTFRRIILPQSIRGILPPMTNDAVALFKDTSLVSAIAVSELNREYLNLSKATGGYLPIAVTTAVLYLCMSVPLGYLSRRLEKRWGTK